MGVEKKQEEEREEKAVVFELLDSIVVEKDVAVDLWKAEQNVDYLKVSLILKVLI